MKYEIYSCRFDIPERLYTSFEADTDEEAMERFQDIRADPSMAWESLRMIEVVVERQTRRIASLNRMSGDGKVKTFFKDDDQ